MSEAMNEEFERMVAFVTAGHDAIETAYRAFYREMLPLYAPGNYQHDSLARRRERVARAAAVWREEPMGYAFRDVMSEAALVLVDPDLPPSFDRSKANPQWLSPLGLSSLSPGFVESVMTRGEGAA